MFTNPKEILNKIGIGEGSVVADLGSGSGHYSLAAAELVGPEGLVYAVDIQESLLEKLEEEANNAKLKNIQIFHGDLESVGGSKLADNAADVVLLCNIMFQAENKEAVLKEAMRVAQKNARIILVDWQESWSGVGPEKERVFNEKDAEELIKQVGAKVEKKFDAGTHSYGLVVRANT